MAPNPMVWNNASDVSKSFENWLVKIVHFNNTKRAMLWKWLQSYLCVNVFFFILLDSQASEPSHPMQLFTCRTFLVIILNVQIESFWATMKLKCVCNESKMYDQVSFRWNCQKIGQPTTNMCSMYVTCFRMESKSSRSRSIMVKMVTFKKVSINSHKLSVRTPSDDDAT